MSENVIDIVQPGSYSYTYTDRAAPIAEVEPGKKVRIHCTDCFENKLTDAQQSYSDVCTYPYLNPQTGPVLVKGVENGDTLLVHIHDIEITRDWAVTGLVPNFGLLSPSSVTDLISRRLPEIVEKLPIRDGKVFYGKYSRPLAPFMGTMGTAPCLEAINALTPSWYGGNMDCPETCAGNTVHLPVRSEKGLFFCGDGHAAQGHGEIGGVACEAPVNLVCTFDVKKGEAIAWPRITNDEYIMTVGSARPLEDAVRIASSELVRWVATECDMQLPDTLVWLTQVMELRVGNVCDPNYSVVAAVKRSYLQPDTINA